MSSAFFTFDYDYELEKWSLPRGKVPSQLKSQGVPHALWMHFWDYSQSVVERASVRSIMKKKLRVECDTGKLSAHRIQEREIEITKLDEQTERDFECLQRQAERIFPNSRARVSIDSQTGRQFGLEIRLLSSTATSDSMHLHYDDSRASWNLPRDVLPYMLAKQGVPEADWMAIWDYGFGVNQRAKEREHLNQLHGRELRLCKKSLAYMSSTQIPSIDENASSSHNSTANHIRMKMEKLQQAIEANANNTKKGWQELQRKAVQRFEPYGVNVYLSHKEEQVCCGLEFQCPKQKRRDFLTASAGSKRTASFSHTTPSAIWLPTSSPIPSPPRATAERTSPNPAVWMTVPKHLSPQRSSELDHLDTSNSPSKTPEKENAPPKPEGARKYRKKESSHRVWGHPVVLTYVHDDVPSQIDIEVSAPLTPTSSAESFDDENSHGYVVPPAPSNPPSSIGSCSSGSVSMKAPKLPKRVHFGENKWHTFENPGYTKADRRSLWFTHDERDASRSKTKELAQRVIDNRTNGGAENVTFIDSETEEEVCWRGLEHAKRGNLSSRQETRRAFLVKVMEKQRLIQLNSWTTRRGTVEDPARELQLYASRQSRQCRERAQKLAAQDAKDARAVYKESLRKPNLHSYRYGGNSVSSGYGSHHSRGSSHRHDFYHQNDIFQDYCRQMHLATKARMQQQPVM